MRAFRVRNLIKDKSIEKYHRCLLFSSILLIYPSGYIIFKFTSLTRFIFSNKFVSSFLYRSLCGDIFYNTRKFISVKEPFLYVVDLSVVQNAKWTLADYPPPYSCLVLFLPSSCRTVCISNTGLFLFGVEWLFSGALEWKVTF